ncbi:MAG: chromosome segregation protein SMC, partial [Planctomycetota bacterium]
MHLKSLSIHGFKSFANPTEFDLDEGLTAIVGPNGCGKSNVIDAVRWAMGEQSARSLRGANMQDIIFNGGGKRGPLGMAEVTLRFSNKDRLLDIDRDEVRFTRRLYRDGTSEYLINSNKARLKDFKELLMDTGAGAKGMVFVEQGRIDALLHASPAERRHVLEEAAGIGKFKVRKHEAQNRLKHVAVDRARLSDLLREVEARYKELKKQANKAKRYVEVREQLQKVQIELSRFRNHDYQAVTESARERVVRFGERQEKEDRKLHKVTVELDGLARDVRERERAVRDLELTLRDLSASEKVRREQAFEEGRRAAECNEDHARGAYQLKGLQEKQARLGREIEASENKLQKRKTDDAGLATRIEELEAKVQGEGQAQKKLREGLDRSRSKLMATLQEEAKLRNRAAELEARARVLAGREERLERRIKEVREGLALREAERSSLKAAIEAAVTRVEELDRDLDRTTEARDEAEETIRDLEESFLTERRALDHTSARLTVLEQLDKEGAGLDPGVKAVLALTSGEGDPDPAHEDAPNGNEVIGALGDLIRPDADYALALEMLLGPTAQWIAVSTQESATEIASWLQREEIGRCRLLPLDTYLERTSKAAPPKLKKAELRKLDEAGFLGWAAEIAQPAPEVLPVLRRLFHRYAIVEDMESALAIVALPAVEGAVTLEGEVVHACGSIEGGVSQSAGRIGRRSERKALEQERVEQEESLHRMQAGLSRWREAEKEAAQKLEQLRTEHHEQKLQAFSLKRDGEERERLLLRSREEDRLATEERDEIRDDRRIALEEREELEREAIVLREDAQDLEERAREQAEALTEVEDELAREREELSVLKVRMARTAEQWEALRNQAKRAAEELADT